LGHADPVSARNLPLPGAGRRRRPRGPITAALAAPWGASRNEDECGTAWQKTAWQGQSNCTELIQNLAEKPEQAELMTILVAKRAGRPPIWRTRQPAISSQ